MGQTATSYDVEIDTIEQEWWVTWYIILLFTVFNISIANLILLYENHRPT